MFSRKNGEVDWNLMGDTVINHSMDVKLSIFWLFILNWAFDGTETSNTPLAWSFSLTQDIKNIYHLIHVLKFMFQKNCNSIINLRNFLFHIFLFLRYKKNFTLFLDTKFFEISLISFLYCNLKEELEETNWEVSFFSGNFHI